MADTTDTSVESTLLSNLDDNVIASMKAKHQNPVRPSGLKLLPQKLATKDVGEWAVRLLNDSEDYPMYSVTTRPFDDDQTLAIRIEWHTWSHRKGKLVHGIYRGATVYQVTDPSQVQGESFFAGEVTGCVAGVWPPYQIDRSGKMIAHPSFGRRKNALRDTRRGEMARVHGEDPSIREDPTVDLDETLFQEEAGEVWAEEEEEESDSPFGEMHDTDSSSLEGDLILVHKGHHNSPLSEVLEDEFMTVQCHRPGRHHIRG